MKLHRTPLVHFCEQQLVKNVRTLLEARKLSGSIPVKVFYAFKSCPLRRVLYTLVREGIDGVETHSLFESEALSDLVPSVHQVVHGGGKEQCLVQRASDSKALTIIADSVSELQYLLTQDALPDFGVRIHPLSYQNDFFFTGCKLGMTGSQVLDVFKELPSCRCKVLHFHLFNRLECLPETSELLVELSAIWNNPLSNFSILNIGGGFNSFDSVASLVEVLKFWQDFAREKLTGIKEIWMEPGRALVSNAAVGYTQVLDLKEINGKNIAVVDMSTNFLVPIPSARFGISRLSESSGEVVDYAIVDQSCSPSSIIVQSTQLGTITVGEILKIENVGAYTISFANPLFHKSLPEIIFEETNGNLQVLWSQETLKQITRTLYG